MAPRGPCAPSGAPQGGGNINDFQQKTYAKIQLSKASEYFPGTVERILMLTGRLKQVRRPAQAESAEGKQGRGGCVHMRVGRPAWSGGERKRS